MAFNLESILDKAIRTEMGTAVGLPGGVLSEQRTALKGAYFGEALPKDEERRQAGLSAYVDRTVMETVEWAKPGLLRVFTSSDEVVRFEPNSPDKEQAAEDATTYVNNVIFGNNAFATLYDIFSDALLQKGGWCKVYYDKTERVRYDEREGLTRDEAMAVLLLTPNPEDVEISAYKDDGLDLYNLRIKHVDDTGRIVMQSLPPENVIWNNGARDVESARFIAHWEQKTLAELLKQGYPKDKLQGQDSGETYPETKLVNQNVSSDADGKSDRDGMMRVIKVYEAYVMAVDKKGEPTRYRVEFVGDHDKVTILKHEPWTMYRPPLFVVSTVPVPHSLTGMCFADLVMDLQRLRSELHRQQLDSLAMGNFGEYVIKDGGGEVDLDQFLSRAPGRVYYTRGSVDITPLPASTMAARDAQAALQQTDQAKETRTGVGQQIQGMSADALQGTATGASIVNELANQRLELTARIIAEQWGKPACRYALALAVKHQNKPIQMRLKGRFFNWNPATWDPDMDVTVSVGLGTGDKSKQVANMQTVLGNQAQMMKELGHASPVRIEHIINALHRQTQGMGMENPEQFYGSVEDARQADMRLAEQQRQQGDDGNKSPEEKVIDAEIAQGQTKIAMDKQRNEAKIQLDQQKMVNDYQLKLMQTRVDMALEQAKLAAETDMQIRQQQAENELQTVKELLQARSPQVVAMPEMSNV